VVRVRAQVLQLLHDTTRVRDIPKRLDVYDDDSAEHLRRFCLAFHDIRAVSPARLCARVHPNANGFD
jgi:GTP pyrophosphokinase